MAGTDLWSLSVAARRGWGSIVRIKSCVVAETAELPELV